MDIRGVEEHFFDEIQKVSSVQQLLNLKSQFLGKKGDLSQVLQDLRNLPPEERPAAGSAANRLKELIENACRERLESLKQEAIEKKSRKKRTDVTLPGRATPAGSLHPVSTTLQEAEKIFVSMGFSVHEGPEIETDYYNFEALNIPPDHPARDMQDTFYIGGITAPSASGGRGPQSAPPVPSGHPPRQAGRFPPAPLGSARSKSDASPLLLRTHTSPVQIHVMEKQKPPVRMIAPGVVFRRDSDVSHSPMFHQIEGLVVGEAIRFSDLKGVLTFFLDRFFGKRNRTRFRPSYFPFTEPSAEVDVWWEGKGWLEIIGCGMVHPNVFRKVRYDPKKVTGFAFGLGIERLAMLKWGIPDIRMFYENDLRFLRQFR